MGRKAFHKFTKGRTKAFLDAIGAAMPFIAACRLAGISHRTAKTWLKLGKQNETPAFRKFYKTYTLNREKWKVKIHKEFLSTDAPWTARAWLLERLAQERYVVRMNAVQVEKAARTLLKEWFAEHEERMSKLPPEEQQKQLLPVPPPVVEDKEDK